jgi:hypothetical protein
MAMAQNRILDDFARLFTDAAGMAQGVRREAERVKADTEAKLVDQSCPGWMKSPPQSKIFTRNNGRNRKHGDRNHFAEAWMVHGRGCLPIVVEEGRR